MKVLFLVPYPTSGASTRYRVEQYLPYLTKHNIDYRVSPFVSERFYKIIYSKGKYAQKIFYLFNSLKRRLEDMLAFAEYDIVFIHLEAFPFGPPLLEYFFSAFKKPIIFDLDDAIYLRNRAFVNNIVKILRCPQKIPKVIGLSSHVIVCNNFLKDYALQFKPEECLTVIHTSLDTDRFIPLRHKTDSRNLVIGWIGSHTTSVYLNQLKDVFKRLAEKYNFILKIIGAGREIRFPGVKVINEQWSLERDIESFRGLDIGIYPLSNDEWIKGKTGFKTMQYMSVGIPCVVSAVGNNLEIVQDGQNGYLANSNEEWIGKLSLLIENPQLRLRLGEAGRKTVVEKYSLKVNAPKFVQVLENAFNERDKD